MDHFPCQLYLPIYLSIYLSVCLSISISIYIYIYIHTSPGYPHRPGPTPPSGLVYQDKAQLGRHLHTIVPRKEAHIEGLASCSRARGRWKPYGILWSSYDLIWFYRILPIDMPKIYQNMGLLWATDNLREFLLGKRRFPSFSSWKAGTLRPATSSTVAVFTISAEPSHV